jgi:hypothetical protein
MLQKSLQERRAAMFGAFSETDGHFAFAKYLDYQEVSSSKHCLFNHIVEYSAMCIEYKYMLEFILVLVHSIVTAEQLYSKVRTSHDFNTTLFEVWAHD